MDMTTSRKDKLLELSRKYDLETEEPVSSRPSGIRYRRWLLKNKLDREIRRCHRCVGLNMHNFTQAVCGWGDIQAKVFIVGEAPCERSMMSQVPFAWKSGVILDDILALSKLSRYNVFISNAVHCHLPGKRGPKQCELSACNLHLQAELRIVKPRLVVTLGNFARCAMELITQAHAKRKSPLPFDTVHAKHPAAFLYSPRGLVNYMLKLSETIDKYATNQ